jgi:hypothetical protein
MNFLHPSLRYLRALERRYLNLEKNSMRKFMSRLATEQKLSAIGLLERFGVSPLLHDGSQVY